MRADAAALLAAATVACVTSQQTARTSVTATAAGVSADADAVVRRALIADAAFDNTADTLYGADALVIANARIRSRAPRLAGVVPGGRVTIAAVNATLEGRFAWLMVDYRWFNLETNQVTAGRATVVCVLRQGGWKIVHLHSSLPVPWER